jgi:hypothetical protein
MEQRDLELTPELKEKLAAYMAITPDREFKYVPAIQRKLVKDKKQWAVFLLKTLDGEQIAELEDSSGYSVLDMQNPNKREWHSGSGTHRIKILKMGLIGWKNYKDKDFKMLPFESVEKSVRFLSEPMKIELCNAITENMTLTEDELRGLE